MRVCVVCVCCVCVGVCVGVRVCVPARARVCQRKGPEGACHPWQSCKIYVQVRSLPWHTRRNRY